MLLSAATLALLVFLPKLTMDLLERSFAEPAGRNYVTAAGERVELTLQDGSTVVLGENSTLRVVSEPSSESRQIHLEGVGLFDVEPDPTRPFVVHMGSAATRVLGTRFVVRAYPREKTIAVAVVEGRVAVQPDASASSPSTALKSGQVAHLHRDGMLDIVQDEQEVNRYLRMARGPVHFVDRPLSDVLDQLEDLYPVRFAVPDASLARQPLTIRVSGERLEDVLDAIGMAMNARYEIHGDTITFISKSGHVSATP